MTRSKKPLLIIIAVGGHVLTLILLWFLLREDNIQEPVFEKIISAKLTTKAPGQLPALNQEVRNEIEKERRETEETAWKKQQETLKKAYEAEAREKQEAEALKKKEAEADEKKKEDQKKKDDDKKADQKKKEMAERKAKEAREKREKAEADKRREAKMQADKRARDAAERAANAQRQAVLGKHVSAAISNQLRTEWNKGANSAIQFDDPNDFVTINFTINRDGRLISARVLKHAKSANLNAKAAALIKIISQSNYRFPPFDKNYDQNSMTIPFDFRTE